MKSSQVKEGSMHSMTLARFVMLPTPCVSDTQGSPKRKDQIGLSKGGSYFRTSDTTGTRFGAKLNDVARLLPTPTVMDTNQGDLSKIDARRARAKEKGANGSGFGISIGELANRSLLPTPQAIDGNGSGRELRLKKDCPRDPEQLGSYRGDLKDFAYMGMLPTPTVNDGINSCLPPSQADRHSGLASVVLENDRKLGDTHQLNPAFVGEMMGFPYGWTMMPFISEPGTTEIGMTPAGFDYFPQTNPTIQKGEIADMEGMTASKWRNESIKAYGNAIVPEVALSIFQAINKYEEQQ